MQYYWAADHAMQICITTVQYIFLTAELVYMILKMLTISAETTGVDNLFNIGITQLVGQVFLSQSDYEQVCISYQ